MYAIKVGDEFIDLAPNGSITIERHSPFFTNDGIPGTLSFPTPATNSKKNQRILGFPNIVSNQTNPSNTLEAQLFVENILYKTGVIRNIKPTKDGYTFTFGTDAQDFQSRINGVSMQSLDLGSETLNLAPDNDNYALFPVSNVGFWGDKNPSYLGYVNYFTAGGAFQASSAQYVVTPFPYLVYILRKTFAHFGYFVSGSFLEDSEINKVVVYNNYALDSTTIDFSNHVPDMTVGEFIIAIKNMFGIGYIFNPTDKSVQIITLNEVIDNQTYVDHTSKSEFANPPEPNESNGFLLKQEIDSNDEELKTESDSWATYKIGNGAEEKPTKASTTLVKQTQDSINTGRSWTIPVVNQKGTSTQNDLGVNKASLRLLMYKGMVNDSLGNPYPAGHYDSGALSLRWGGSNGLYELKFKKWLDFLGYTIGVPRNIRFNIVDILTLEMSQKTMIEYNKFIFSKITTTISQKDGMKPSKCEMYKVKL